jgi:hypothetical protein
VCEVGTFAGAPFLIDYADAQWLNDRGIKLDSVISKSVAASKKRGIAVSYVDPSTRFGNHGFCDSEERWFHEVQYEVSVTNPLEPELTLGPLASSFHPTEVGERFGYEAAFAATIQ